MWLPLFLQKKAILFKCMLHWRSTELRSGIENNLSCSSKCVLETVFNKNRALFYAHTTCIKIPRRNTEGKYIIIDEVNSHTKVLKFTWRESKCFNFLFKRILIHFYLAFNTLPSFWTLTRVNALKGAIMSVHTATISGKKIAISQILCFIMHFYEILFFNQ